jgi:tetratricopeptide (TPR) repeat protein
MKSLMLAIGIATLVATGSAATLPFGESWYLLRARANMQIKNYRAAIEGYQKALAINPDNAEAARGLGIAYESQGLTDKAIEQFDRYLAKFPDDAEINFKQAKYLEWSRYQYRRGDAIKYYQRGLAQKDDPAMRRRMARLMAGDKSHLDEALETYQRLLAAHEDESTRQEYRELLAWDKRHINKAIEEYQGYLEKHPHHRATEIKLARLLAQAPDRRPEALGAYRSLVETNPSDPGLRLEYARLLSAAPSETEEAVAQYRRVLEQKADTNTRVAYADLLASREATRREALDEYRRALKEHPENNRVRLKYAKLLGAKKDDNRAAIDEYQRVLSRDPNNGEAHRGMAASYAWLGDNDRALYHAKLAGDRGAANRETLVLQQNLAQGREPKIESQFNWLTQPGSDLGGLTGFIISAKTQTDLGPFFTVSAEGGAEIYDNDPESITGPYAAAGAEYRFSEVGRVSGSVEYHPLKSADRGLAFRAQATFGSKSFAFSPGFKRELRYDSYLSTVGRTMQGRPAGAARSNLFFSRVEWPLGPIEIAVTPEVGWVSTQDDETNLTYQVIADATVNLWSIDTVAVGISYQLHAAHYAKDYSGLFFNSTEPFPGGYFSPSIFVSQTPQLKLRLGTADQFQFDIAGGPSLQYVSTTISEFRLGAELSLATHLRFTPNWGWELRAAFSNIPEVYRRFSAGTVIAYRF